MISADKKLGQHFLVNPGVVARIADQVAQCAHQQGTDARVIEIGPGPGALTEALLARGLSVTAVELDARMIELLRKKFSDPLSRGQLVLKEGDALRIPLEELGIGRAQLSGSAVICGNLPYNVGSHLVFRFLEECPRALRFCYMLQKEVVKKFISALQQEHSRRDYGPPSIRLAWCTRLREVFWVSPGSFRPPPRVESGVFCLERLEGGALKADPCERGGLYEKASRLVDQAFAHRRKMLRSSFPELASTDWGTRRPEELSPEDFLSLAQKIDPSLALG